MANSNVRKTIAAAFPLREVKQPNASEVSPPDVFAWASVPAPPNAADAPNSATLSQVLQATLKDVSTAVTEANKQLSALLPVQQQNLDKISQNTQALVSNTASRSSGGGTNALTTAGRIASSLFGGGSLLSPIISGLMNLFGGRTTPEPVFTAFTMPAPIHLDATLNRDAAKEVQVVAPADVPTASAGSAPRDIQITVNAIDSKSFLDHSDQIAQAVRLALLHSHPLADVIAEI